MSYMFQSAFAANPDVTNWNVSNVINMKRMFYILSLGIGAMILATGHAFAQQSRCTDHATFTTRLATQFGESRQAIALTSANRVLEVFASTETGSWTITLTDPGGPTCMVAAGQGFELTNTPQPATDSGA